MISQVHGFRSRHTTNPRTVLGFFAIVIGLLLTAVVGSVATLAATETATYLIPWILAFAAAVIVLVLVGVFLVSKSDPSKLLLTQVTGTEYATIQMQTVLGDSASGERREPIATQIPTAIPMEPVTSITLGPANEEPSADTDEPT